MPKNRERDDVDSVGAQVWPEQKELYVKAAEAEGVSIAEFVREACDEAAWRAAGLKEKPKFRPFVHGKLSQAGQAARKAGMSTKELGKLALETLARQILSQPDEPSPEHRPSSSSEIRVAPSVLPRRKVK